MLKLKLYFFIGIALLTVVGGAYAYYKDTQKRLQLYAENQAKLEVAVTTQKAATESLQNDIVVMSNAVNQLNKDFEESRQAVAKLQSTFNESANGEARDFGNLAVKKPAAIERIINNGSQDVMKCIEILSGNIGDYNEQDVADCTGKPIPNDGM
jgi:hypothetical protein